MRAAFLVGIIVLLSGCSFYDRQDYVVIGYVNSISSDDVGRILEVERVGILKQFHTLPTRVMIEVVNHNKVSVSFTIHGQQCVDGVYRIRGKWTRPDLPRAIVET